MRTVSVLAVLGGCAGGEGRWVVETWGEDYIEAEIPADAFADGCSVRYDEFAVVLQRRELVDGNGDVAGELGGPEVFDLHVPGPVPMGEVTVPADHYSEVVVVVAPRTASA